MHLCVPCINARDYLKVSFYENGKISIAGDLNVKKGEETISSIESLRVTGCNKSLDDCAALCHDFILSCYYEYFSYC